MPSCPSALLVGLLAIVFCTAEAFHLPVPSVCNGPLPNATRMPSKLFDNKTFAMLSTFHRLVAATPTVVKPTNVSYHGTATIAELYNRTQPLSDVVNNAVFNITVSTATAAGLAWRAHNITQQLLAKLANGTLTTSALHHELQLVNESLRSANALGGDPALQAGAIASAALSGMDTLVQDALDFGTFARVYEYEIKEAAKLFKKGDINETTYNEIVTKYETSWRALNETRAANYDTLRAMNGMFYPPNYMLEEATGVLLAATSDIADCWRQIPGVLVWEKNRVLLRLKLDVLSDTIFQVYNEVGWVMERACTNVFLNQ